MTAEKAGNKGVDVLSTSMLVQLVETAALACIEPLLGPDSFRSAPMSTSSTTNRCRSGSSFGPRSRS